MLKKTEKIIRESAFDKKKKKPGLNFNPGLVLTSVRTTGPWSTNHSTYPLSPPNTYKASFQATSVCLLRLLNMGI